jgi:multiple sugar transport system substrate-binding protein
MGQEVTRRQFLAATAGAAVLAACARDPLNRAPATERAISGPSSYEGPSVALDYWTGFTGGDGPVMQAMVAAFNDAHPNVSVTMNLIRWEDFYQKVPAAVFAGRGPDLGIMHVDRLATFAAQKVIVSLDPIVETLGFSAADFAPTVWEGGVYEGSHYGIPLDMHPLGFYYNKTVMEQGGLDPNKPPTNNDEYLAALEQLKSKGIKGCWVSPFLFTGALWFRSLVPQFGGELFTQDGERAAFNSEAGVAALTWMVDLVRKGYSPPKVGQDGENNAFMNDENAFIWNGPWIFGLYDSNPALKWGVAPLPRIGSQPGAWANSHNFVIMNQRDPDPNRLAACAAFIDWMSANSLDWADAGMIPARRSVRESKEFAKLPVQTEFAKEIPYIHFDGTAPGIVDPENAVNQAVSAAVLSTQSPAEALDDAARVADDLLARNRRTFGA